MMIQIWLVIGFPHPSPDLNITKKHLACYSKLFQIKICMLCCCRWRMLRCIAWMWMSSKTKDSMKYFQIFAGIHNFYFQIFAGIHNFYFQIFAGIHNFYFQIFAGIHKFLPIEKITLLRCLIIIFYIENVTFFHAELGSDVCPRVDSQTSGDTLQDLTQPLSGKITIIQLSNHGY